MTNQERLENQTGHGATPDHAGKEAPKLIRHTILFVLVAFALGTCSGEGSQGEPTDSSTPAGSVNTTTTAVATNSEPAITTTSEKATAAGTALPILAEHGPTAVVEGREDCRLYPMVDEPTTTRDDDGTVLIRDGRFECTVTNSDPRIAGTAHYTLDMNRWGTSAQDASQVMWGTIRIENDDGAWEADYAGVYTSEWGDVFTALFRGTGAYAGLAYYQWAVETRGPSWPTKGVIFPIEHGPPAP